MESALAAKCRDVDAEAVFIGNSIDWARTSYFKFALALLTSYGTLTGDNRPCLTSSVSVPM